jgi:type I restriction enzyme S subunit
MKTAKPPASVMSMAHELRADWRWGTLGEVLSKIESGKSFQCDERPPRDNEIGIIKVSAVTWGIYNEAESKTCFSDSSFRENYLVKPGDFLFSRANTLDLIGACVLVRQTQKRLMLSDKILRFHFDGVLPEFTLWYLRGPEGRSEIQRLSTGNQESMRNIGQERIRLIRFPIVHVDVQRVIVSQLEARLSRLDKAAGDLRKVEAKLARHRASVLAAATSGTLVPTEAELARREGRAYEPASVLLDRILAERRARWEAEQIATFRAKGQTPRDDKWKAKYQPPVAPDTTDLPELPEGWVWASVDQLAADEPRSITDGPFGSNLKSEHYTESGPRVIRLQNIGDGNFVDERAHIRQDHFESLANHHVHPGDIVLAALGEVLPRACIIPDDLGPALVKADCMRVKPDPALVFTRYLLAALISPQVQHRTASVVKGVGRPRINLGTVRGLPMPLPPLAEQRRIVQALEQGHTIYTQTLRAAVASRRRVAGLRSAILQAAFQPPAAAHAS